MCCRVSYSWHHDFPKLAKEAGFCFNDPKLPGNFDWATIGALDVDRIYKERDFAGLEYSLRYILEGPLGSLLDSHVLDPAVSKLFRVSQLAVQYLLFCKQFLDRSVSIMRDSIQQYQKEIASLKKNVKTKDEQIFKLRQKRNLLPDPFSSAISNNPLIPTPTCHVCSKTFLNVIYLQAHMLRRHQSDELPVRDSGPGAKDVKATTGVINFQPQLEQVYPGVIGSKSTKDEQLIDNVKLMLEIKQLKDRLANAEKSFIANTTEKNPYNKTPQINVLQEVKRKDVSVNTDYIIQHTYKTDDQQKYREEIIDLKEHLTKSLEDLQSQNIWSEVRQKMDLQENLWKTRCDALENKLEVDNSRLMEMLNNIISSKSQIEKIKGKPIELEVFREEDFKHQEVTKHEPKIMTVSSVRNQKKVKKQDTLRKSPIEIQAIVKSCDVEQSLSSDSISSSVKSPVKIVPRKVLVEKPMDADNLMQVQDRNEVSQFEKVLSDIVEDEEIQKGHDGEAEKSVHGKDDIKLGEDSTSNEASSIVEDLKPHTSASTLQRRSVTSLREALLENPEELQKYRDSMISDLNTKLWQLNINPSHGGLLDLNFQNTMQIIAHERKLKNKQSMKYGQNLDDIRADLEKTVNGVLEKRGHFTKMYGKLSSKVGKKKEIFQQQPASSNISRVKTAMAAFRTKSMEILPNLLKKHDVKKSPTKDTTFEFEKGNKKPDDLGEIKRDFDIHSIRFTSSPKKNEDKRLEEPKGKIQNIQKPLIVTKELYYSDTASISSEDTLDDFDLDMPKPKPRASTSLEKLLASPIKKPEPFDFDNIIRRTSSPQIDQQSTDEKNRAQNSDDQKPAIQQPRKLSLAERPIVLQSSLEDHSPTSSPLMKFTSQPMKIHRIFSRPSSSRKDGIYAEVSTESEISGKHKLSEANKHQPETQDKPRRIFRMENVVAQNSNFQRNVESAIMGAEKKRVVFDLDANTHKTLSSNGGSQDESDYGLASIESIGPTQGTTYKPDPIILSTKQSPKIAEIAKEIQGQLKTLPTKPIGGIITGITPPIKEGNDLLEEYSSKTLPNQPTDKKPLPKPRSKPVSPNILDDLILSDFSF